jgi:hypothetical protein
VGGVSSAANRETAIGAAEADAKSQLHLAAVGRFNTLFSSAVASSDVETSGLERLDFKRTLGNDYAGRLVDASVRDTVFVRPCIAGQSGEGGTASASGGSGSSDVEGDSRVGKAICQAFVRISLDENAWDQVLAELLEAEKRRRREDGQESLAELADWMLRDVMRTDPMKRRERQ